MNGMARGAVTLFLVLLHGTLGAGEPPGEVHGLVRDAATGEALAGVTVVLKGTTRGAVTDAGGRYAVKGVEGERCTLVVSYVSYRTVEVTRALEGRVTRVDVELEEEVTAFEEVVVSGRRRRETEVGLVNTIKVLPQVANGVSAAQIARGPDRVASEVVRRVPGITVMDERLIVVRGLSPRYNTTWIDGGTVPGTEGDGRAFPFDLVPGSQIDHLLVQKSPSADAPADFSGGFVRIVSKGVPDENRTEVSYGTGFNTRTGFAAFRYNPGSATDFLGFDVSKRPLGRRFPAHVGGDAGEVTRLTREGFNGDWRVREGAAMPDQRLSLLVARRGELAGRAIGHVTSLTFSNTARRVPGMKNARHGIYSASADRPVILDDYLDDLFTREARVGLVHNWAYEWAPGRRVEWKNLLNVLGSNRLTEREGVKDMSSMYFRRQTEMRYTSRLVFCTRLAGRHEGTATGASSSWDAAFSFASRGEPDRRIVTYHAGIGSVEDIPSAVPMNESITRYFQRTREHGFTLAADHARPLGGATVKAGARVEFSRRGHVPREFIYRYDNLSSEERQAYLRLPFQEMLRERYLGADRVYIDEITRKTNAYGTRAWLLAAYLAGEARWGRLAVYPGVRVEYHDAVMTRDRSDAPGLVLASRRRRHALDVFPSVNARYDLSPRQQLRLAYGRSINRPEAREVSPTVYFDFDLFSEIGGNEGLRPARVHNLDVRHEWYPSATECLSTALFYKHFRDPIEWTFVDMGGSLRYHHENAARATAWGVEVEARVTVCTGLVALVNLAWIRGRVFFRPGEVVPEPDRSMQGLSPYIVNAGLFYRGEGSGFQASILYNRVGRRIVGLGKSNSIQPDVNTFIPNAYEMPRDVLDVSLRQAIGRRVEVQCALKDVLARDVLYKQFPRFRRAGVVHEREQVTRRYNPGCSLSLGITVQLD